MPFTATAPGTTVVQGPRPPYFSGRAHSTSVKTTLLVVLNTGTYGNGYEVASAALGDSNVAEGFVYQVEIMARHPQINTPYDKNTTAFAVGDNINVIRHTVGQEYWLPASSITAVVGSKIICAASGLVAVQTAHTATPLPHHYWVCTKAVTSGSWVLAEYRGISSMFTA